MEMFLIAFLVRVDGNLAIFELSNVFALVDEQ